MNYEMKSIFCHECKEHTSWDVEFEKLNNGKNLMVAKLITKDRQRR